MPTIQSSYVSGIHRMQEVARSKHTINRGGEISVDDWAPVARIEVDAR